MTGPKRVVGALSISALGLFGASMAAPTVASAAPSVASLTCGYPPGACTVDTSQGTYSPGAVVQTHTREHSFTPHEVVVVVVTGPRHFHKRFTQAAGAKGGFATSFKLPKSAKKGRYTLSFTGRHSGHHLKGHLNVS